MTKTQNLNYLSRNLSNILFMIALHTYIYILCISAATIFGCKLGQRSKFSYMLRRDFKVQFPQEWMLRDALFLVILSTKRVHKLKIFHLLNSLFFCNIIIEICVVVSDYLNSNFIL